MKKLTVLMASVVVALWSSLSAAQDKPVAIPEVSEGWRGSITPYIWLTNISGSVYYDQTRLGGVNYGSSQLMSNLNFAGMVTGEAHKGNVGFMADLVYSKISPQKSFVIGQSDIGSRTTIEQGIYTLAGTYTLYNTKNAYVDGLAGIRVMTTNSTTDLNVIDVPYGTVKAKSKTITDPIVGMKGRVRIDDTDFFIPFYLDVGGGTQDTDLTSQQMLGVGRAFEWGDVTLAFKNLYYKQKMNSVTTNQNLFGGAVGVTFKF